MINVQPTTTVPSGDGGESPARSAGKTVTVVEASGALGGYIVEALLQRGVHVRAMVRATSDRSRLERLGVTDFVVADLNDPASLEVAMAAKPAAAAVIASVAGFSAHSARTKGDNSRTDTEGYRSLIDATKHAGVPRFVLISILECDKAHGVPHFYQKYETEQYLAKKEQPYLALRAGAFLDRSRDIVPDKIRKGVFPDILPGVPMALVYSRELARYAVKAALDLPASDLSQSVDIGSEIAGTGEIVAAAFTRALGRPIAAKPVFSRLVFAFLPLIARFRPRLRDQAAVMKWLRKGDYVIKDSQKQRRLFGDVPSIDDTVARYCKDKGLA